nr:hypothetical protein [uncultured Sphaerochaeta sp.]
MKKMVLIISILILYSHALIWGQIEVDYDNSNTMAFQIGTTPLFPDGNLIALMGTMTFNTNGNPLFDPAFMAVSPVTNGISFSGDRYSYTDSSGQKQYNNNSSFGFRIVAVTNLSNGGFLKQDITSASGTPMVPGASGNQASKISSIQLYLVSWETNMANKVRFGSNYTLTSNNLETFNIATADKGSGFYQGYTYAKINNKDVPSDGSMPLPGQSFRESPIGAIPFGEVISEPILTLTIQSETGFSIENAYGTDKTKIAEAQLTLQNTESGKTYGVEVTFSNSMGSQSFNLHLDGQRTLFAIPYLLIFGGEPVTGSAPFDWVDLSTSAPNIRSIEVSGIDQDRADMAPAGLYQDTITISIIPKDTL